MSRNYNKHLPADNNIYPDKLTFLTDKKVDERLQSYLMSISEVLEVDGDKKTVVYKINIPKQAEICKILRQGSRNTYRAHFDYLLKEKWIMDEGDQQVMNTLKEEWWIEVPVDTLDFMAVTCTEDVIKTYIYLKTRYNYKGSGYLFTIKEIAEHTGIKLGTNGSQQDKINYILISLKNNGLIEQTDGIRQGKIPYMRLDKVNVTYKNVGEKSTVFNF